MTFYVHENSRTGYGTRSVASAEHEYCRRQFLRIYGAPTGGVQVIDILRHGANRRERASVAVIQCRTRNRADSRDGDRRPHQRCYRAPLTGRRGQQLRLMG